MSYEKLGDLSFNTKDYVSAQKYYDSCARFISEDYPNGDLVKNKAAKLADLVKAVETANFEDSVQRIAKMSEKDREDFLKETLKEMKRDQQRRKEQEAAKLLALQQNQAPTGVVNNSNKFIFNNPKLREDGYNEFRKLWGQRENEDDWRRSDKIVMNVAANPSFIEENLNDICASIQHSIIEILMDKMKLAVNQTGINRIAIGGGVSANSGIIPNGKRIKNIHTK